MDKEPALHSRRPITLRFDIPTSRTRRFWDSLGEGKFVTTRCSACGNLDFPPQADCPKCMGSEPEWVELSGRAALVTYTKVQVAPASFASEAPYVIAIGELDEGPKVLAWLEAAEPSRLSPGMKLRLEIRRAGTGNPYYVFVPG